MMVIDVCPICLKRKQLTRHHLWKTHVWGNSSEIELICQNCHRVLEEIVKKKEGRILRQYPEIYAGTFNELLAVGEEVIEEHRRKFKLKPTKGKHY